MKHLPGWPEFCMALLGLSLGGIGASLALLGRGHVDASFALAALSLVSLLLGMGGLLWWAVLDALRRPMASEQRFLYLGLIFLLVPVGAILYYWHIVRSASSPQSSPRD